MRKSTICPTAGAAVERKYRPDATLGEVLITSCRLAKRIDETASAANPAKLAIQVQCSRGHFTFINVNLRALSRWHRWPLLQHDPKGCVPPIRCRQGGGVNTK